MVYCKSAQVNVVLVLHWNNSTVLSSPAFLLHLPGRVRENRLCTIYLTALGSQPMILILLSWWVMQEGIVKILVHDLHSKPVKPFKTNTNAEWQCTQQRLPCGPIIPSLLTLHFQPQIRRTMTSRTSRKLVFESLPAPAGGTGNLLSSGCRDGPPYSRATAWCCTSWPPRWCAWRSACPSSSAP